MVKLIRSRKVQHCEATWQTLMPQRHSFSIFMGFKRWPILVADQIFLPRLKIQIKNEGETIPWAQVSVEIAEFSDPSTFSNYQGPFRDVKHFEFKDFLGGQIRTESLTIPSKFLRPVSYMIRVTVRRFEPSPSVFEMLKANLLGDAPFTSEKVDQLNRALETVQRNAPGIDLYKAPQGQYQGVALCDWRLHDVLKVHSVAGPAGITAAIATPAALAALVALAVQVFNFLSTQLAKFGH